MHTRTTWRRPHSRFPAPQRAPLRRPGRRGAGLHTDGPGAKGRGPPIPAGPAQLCGAALPLLGSRANPLTRRLYMQEGGSYSCGPCPVAGGRGHVQTPTVLARGKPGGRGAHWGARTFCTPPPLPFACPTEVGCTQKGGGGGKGRAPHFTACAKQGRSLSAHVANQGVRACTGGPHGNGEG
jgi:hypothetical protein